MNSSLVDQPDFSAKARASASRPVIEKSRAASSSSPNAVSASITSLGVRFLSASSFCTGA